MRSLAKVLAENNITIAMILHWKQLTNSQAYERGVAVHDWTISLSSRIHFRVCWYSGFLKVMLVA
jgi:hypothetical protein